MNNPVPISDAGVLILKMEKAGFSLSAQGSNLRVEGGTLTDDQLKYLKHHKTEILQHLADMGAANQSIKRYAYRFTLKNNKGGGTYITDCPPAQAKQELLDQFAGREIESIDLLN